MKLVMEFDRKLLKRRMFRFILLVCEIINGFLWLFTSIRLPRTSVVWSVSILLVLLVAEWYELLFQVEDERLVFLYEKIKYFPVKRRAYWLNKVILSGETVLIHIGVGLICGFLGSFL